jgi:hypothetical protein
VEHQKFLSKALLAFLVVAPLDNDHTPSKTDEDKTTDLQDQSANQSNYLGPEVRITDDTTPNRKQDVFDESVFNWKAAYAKLQKKKKKDHTKLFTDPPKPFIKEAN